MNKCIVCDNPTTNYIMWKDKKELTPQYVCEECMWESINKDRAKYKIKYDKAVKYLKDKNYKVVVTGYNDYREVFEINQDLMECVDIIIERMEKQNYIRTWIDIESKVYEDCLMEVVTYISFAKKDEENQAFWIELTNKL